MEVVEVSLGKSRYSVAKSGDPEKIGGVHRYVVVSEDGKPIVVHRSNGQDFHVTYNAKRAARTTALALTQAGLPAKVHEKRSA